MSRTYSRLHDKHPNHSKYHFQKYLYSENEPREYFSNNSKAELIENIESLRQNFRNQVRKIRNR